MKQAITMLATVAAIGIGTAAQMPAAAAQNLQPAIYDSAGQIQGQSGFIKVGHRHRGQLKFGRRSHRLLSQLQLSQVQRDQIFQIRHDAAPAVRERRMAVREAHRALNQVAFTEQLDLARVDAAIGQLATAKANMARLKAQTNHQIYQVLDDAQRAQLQDLLSR